jgi:hypothetical protein
LSCLSITQVFASESHFHRLSQPFKARREDREVHGFQDFGFLSQAPQSGRTGRDIVTLRLPRRTTLVPGSEFQTPAASRDENRG